MKLRLESRYLMVALLMLPIALLTLVIGEQLVSPNKLQASVGKNKPAPALPALLPEFTLPPMDQSYSDMLLLPLFVPTRKPPPIVVVTAPKPAMQKGQFTLMGVVITNDKVVALLRNVATNKVTRVEKGQEINGLRLDRVENGKIVLTQGDDIEELAVKIQPGKPKIPPPLIAPGSPPPPPVRK